MTTVALLTEAERLAMVSDALVDTYAKELQRVLLDLERELRGLIREATEGKVSSIVRASRAGKLRQQISAALGKAGYDTLSTSAASAGLDRLLAQVMRLREASNLAAFTPADSTRILALQELAKRDLMQQGTEAAHAVWRTLVQGIFSQRPVDHLMQDLADALDIEAKMARTLYDTIVGIFARQVEAMKTASDEDETPYAYLGPVDGKVRPFCLEHVGKVYTKAEIDAMDNHQLPNVFLTGGGYNCRHVWSQVSKLSSLRELVGTRKRIPEVDDQMARRAA